MFDRKQREVSKRLEIEAFVLNGQNSVVLHIDETSRPLVFPTCLNALPFVPIPLAPSV